MSAELHDLSGSVIQREAVLRDEDIAEVLTDLQKLNESGMLDGIAFVSLRPDGSFDTDWVYNAGKSAPASALLGAVAQLQFKMQVSMENHKRDRSGGPDGEHPA